MKMREFFGVGGYQREPEGYKRSAAGRKNMLKTAAALGFCRFYDLIQAVRESTASAAVRAGTATVTPIFKKSR